MEPVFPAEEVQWFKKTESLVFQNSQTALNPLFQNNQVAYQQALMIQDTFVETVMKDTSGTMKIRCVKDAQ